MSVPGVRRFGDVRATSALPLIADARCEDQQVRKVPPADVIPMYLLRWYSVESLTRSAENRYAELADKPTSLSESCPSKRRRTEIRSLQRAAQVASAATIMLAKIEPTFRGC